MSQQNFCQNVRYEGESVWAVILLGPGQVSALRNSKVSAFQVSDCMQIYGDGAPDQDKVSALSSRVDKLGVLNYMQMSSG